MKNKSRVIEVGKCYRVHFPTDFGPSVLHKMHGLLVKVEAYDHIANQYRVSHLGLQDGWYYEQELQDAG